MQFDFDNADVNIATATGHGTFRVMGGNSGDELISKLKAFKPLHLPEPLCKLKMSGVNLQTCGRLASTSIHSHPFRAGLIPIASSTGEYEKASIVLLSFINRNPTQLNTIFSVRCYAKRESNRL